MKSRVGTMFGRYKITGLVGEGGMGSVYQAYDTDKDRTVALKVLAEQYSQDERFREWFKRESHAAAVLQEPHVIPIHDWGEIDGSLFIDMRLIEGATLHDLLQKGPLDPARAVGIIGQVAAALDAAHAQGLIHRDVKPQNIIVTPADFAYLVDFGIAESKGETRLTMAGNQIGTFQYMAPERFGDQEATAAVDVYSLTCVLYETLTGDTPFPSDSLEAVMAAHMIAPPPWPSAVNPAVPVAFDGVIARGMAKDPDDRYGSAGARRAHCAMTADSHREGYRCRPCQLRNHSHRYGPGRERPTFRPRCPPQTRDRRKGLSGANWNSSSGPRQPRAGQAPADQDSTSRRCR